jgi:CheY-like chemotaxis protein
VVTVLLPLATDAPLSGAETTGEAERPDVSPPQAHEVSAVDAPGELHGVTIVLVDDESAVRRLVRRLLERVGATVLEAGNGADGLAVWTTHRDAVTLVVTDVRMPVMDGEALVHLLRVESPGLPVVMMSGYTEQTTVDLATRTAFVRKPFALDVLLKAISGVRA